MTPEVVIDNRLSATGIWEWPSDLVGFEGRDASITPEKWDLAVRGTFAIKLFKLPCF